MSLFHVVRRSTICSIGLVIMMIFLVFGCIQKGESQAVASAKIHGTVTDVSGAAVPRAVITATQTESGFVLTAVSNDTGAYTLPNLPVGPYTLTVKATGYSAYDRSGLLLQVNNDAAIDAVLKVGADTETVTVNAEANQVQTEDTTISTVVDQQRTVDLPLNGRNAASLVLISAGSAPTGNGDMTSSKTYGGTGVNAVGGSVNTSVAGGQGNQINYLLDGGDHNDSFSNVNMPFPFPDVLQEFSVQATGLSAQYGVHPSGAVNIVTKSGTNSFHGGVFEFLRNSYANATNRVSGLNTDLKRNQFGGYVGGPIIANKMFFFGGYQRTVLRIAPGTSSAYIPTTAMLNGDWTSYVAANTSTKLASSVGFVTNATTGTTTINTNLYSPAAVNLMKYLPVSSTENASGLVKYSVPVPQEENQWFGRIDYSLNSRHSVFARYFMTNYYQTGLFKGNLLNAVNPSLKDRGKFLTLGDNYTITPNIVNALRLTGTRMSVTRDMPSDLISPTDIGVSIYDSVANYIYISVSGGFADACSTCAPSHYVTNHVQLADDVSYSKGKHFIQGGFDFIQEQLNLYGVNGENGQIFFSGVYSGNGLADLLLGAPSTFNQSYGPASYSRLRNNYFGYYAQDTYHPTKKLTINAGLRWEPWFPEHEKNNVGGNFSLDKFNSNTTSSVFVNAPAGMTFYGDKGVARGFIKSRFTNFSPRFGLSYDPTGTGKQSIRASYTLTFDSPELYTDVDFAQNAPWASKQAFTVDNSTNMTDAVKSFDNPWKKISGGNPFPTTYPPTSTASFPSSNMSAEARSADLRRTYMHQYNASYQLQATRTWLLTASYVGTHTLHLWGPVSLNYSTPVATADGSKATTSNTTQRLILYRAALANGTTSGQKYAGFNALSDYGMANYNGALFSANHRLANNFSILVNYTYSHCMSNMNYVGDSTNTPQNPSDIASEYSNCNFDVSQNVNVSGVIVTPKLRRGILNYAAGSWQFSPLINYRTGMPYTITVGTDNSLTGIGLDRPNVVSGASRYAKNLFPASGYPVWANKSAYSTATSGTFGNERPFSQRGPGYCNIDLAVSKRLPLYKGTVMELRGEAFNLFNHPNYSNPVTAMNSTSTFGHITSTANDARLLQIATKITF